MSLRGNWAYAKRELEKGCEVVEGKKRKRREQRKWGWSQAFIDFQSGAKTKREVARIPLTVTFSICLATTEREYKQSTSLVLARNEFKSKPDSASAEQTPRVECGQTKHDVSFSQEAVQRQSRFSIC
jgi:hypothetical protein